MKQSTKQLTLFLISLCVPFAYSQANERLAAFASQNNLTVSDLVELVGLCDQTSKKSTPPKYDIIFTPQEMTDVTSGTPNTTFSNVYGSGYSINAWKLHLSTTTQDPIRTNFAIPKNFKKHGSLFVDVHVLVSKLCATGNQGQITVSVDYQKNNTEIGTISPADGFSQVAHSENFTITEPATYGNLYHIIVSVELNAELAKDKDFAYIAITRSLPSGVEYNRDIYLASIAFRYE